MATLDINDLASLGVISDVPSYQLPPEAWTTALNMRYRDEGVESLLGWERIFGNPLQAPHIAFPMSTTAANFWIYASLLAIYLFDGTNHTDISRISGPYTASFTREWNYTIFGGIPILNNGVDVPQSRPNMSLATRFQDMPNWPATLRTRVMRSFTPYLMAFGLVDAGTSFPHTIQWSHPADPGALPISWDYTDPTKDAGRKDLDDVNSGIILDALPLASQMYIYKENSTWRTTPIGGRFIFDFKTVFENSGILAPRCVALVGDAKRHFVVTQDDILWHNGTKVVSILDKKQRAKLFGEIDTVNYINSFVFANPLYNEMWFCYPTKGNVNPTKALIWNHKEGGEAGVVSFADGITFRNAAIGNVQGDSDELWSQGTDEWDEDTGPWSEFSRRRVILCGTDGVRFFNLDRTSTRDGAVFTSTLSREALALLGRKRTGQWIVNHRVKKLFQSLWPKIQGGPVNVRIGVQELVDGPIAWQNVVSFDPTLNVKAMLDPCSGRTISIEFSNSAARSWRIDGYQIDVQQLGEY